MKKIITNKYRQIFGMGMHRGPNLNTHPTVPKREEGPSKTIFKEDEDTEEDIKKRWRKKRKK